jgi:small multidrug resistance pump
MHLARCVIFTKMEKRVAMKNWLFLSIAIITEVIATSALKATNGFTRFWPSLVVVMGYGLSFYFMSLALHSIPVGVAYAVWSGVGIILITLIARVAYDQRLDLPAMIGMGLIVVGVIVMNLFSKTVAH